jgi:class 3 adenylate cyclase
MDDRRRWGRRVNDSGAVQRGRVRRTPSAYRDVLRSRGLHRAFRPARCRGSAGGDRRLSRRCRRRSRTVGRLHAKYMGDGVLIYFGYPQAPEDDAEQALRAGLAVVDRIGRLEFGGTRRAIRVGVARACILNSRFPAIS